MRAEEISRLLPWVFQRTAAPGNPLYALIEVMETLQTPSELVLAQLDGSFAPYRAPERFVPYLAGWLGLERLLTPTPDRAGYTFPAGPGQLRELLAAAAELSRARGTAAGLLRFLETATGVTGFVIDEHPADADGRPRPFHIAVTAPVEAERYHTLIEQIIELEKPAYVTYTLTFSGAPERAEPPTPDPITPSAAR
jgi:phage tail-like protein